MKFTIKHESRGRMRVHMEQYRMTYEQADTLLYVIHNHRNVTFVKVYDRTADAVIEYVGDREQIIELLRHFHYESANVPQTVIKTSGRELNNSYQEKLIGSVVWHYSKKLLLPLPIRIALTIGRSVKYIGIGLKCLLQRKIEVPVLDATAITVSLVTKDFSTASSIMFLLGIGELLEEWTHKKSVDDLARSMSLNVSKVWLRTPENQEILVESSKIEKGDKVVVHMGNVIPFDGDTLGRFRNLLLRSGLQEKLFAQVVYLLQERGLLLKKGTIVDSTLIAAPSSTKNREKKRDPEAHSVKKGNSWHFGYKAHIGVDKDSGLVHTVKVTSANIHDVTMVPELLTGDEDSVYGDSGCLGAEKREDAVLFNVNGQGKRIRYKINRRPSQSKHADNRSRGQIKRREKEKSSVRAKVEHVFGVVKGQLRYRKTRYRGLRKQIAKLNILFALANLILADRRSCLTA